MLRQRVATAIVLLLLLLPAVFSSVTWPFTALTLILIGAAAWEWSRLNGVGGAGAVLVGLLLAGAGAAAWVGGWANTAPAWLWRGAAALWMVISILMLFNGVAAWGRWPMAARMLGGLLALWLAWLALAGAKVVGVNFLLSVFCTVWMADIAAYAGGRRWGQRKLAPSISPGKSWEGALTGALGVMLLAWSWVWLDRDAAMGSMSIYTVAWHAWGGLGVFVTASGLCAMSVVGDLVESLVKRSAGAKDSSQLLPGHGGVLDRVDALIPVFPLALAIQSFGAA